MRSLPATRVTNNMKPNGILKKIFCITAGLITLPIFSILLAAIYQIANDQDSLNSNNSNPRPVVPTTHAITLDHSHFLKRLIDIQRNTGTNADYVRAEGIISAFVGLASTKIAAPMSLNAPEVKRYYRDIANLIDQYFIYVARTNLADGFANQTIDCDLRAYLYKTVADKAGVKTAIISAPSHAYIGWKNPTRPSEEVFWETTGKAGLIDLTDTQTYATSEDKNDYTHLSDKKSEHLYEIYASIMAFSNGIEPETNAANILLLYSLYPDWSLLKSAWLNINYEKGVPPSKKAVSIAKEIVRVRPNNATGHYTLLDHYTAIGDDRNIAKHFDIIDKDRLDLSDLIRFSDATIGEYSAYPFPRALVAGYQVHSKTSIFFGKKPRWGSYVKTPRLAAIYNVVLILLCLAWWLKNRPHTAKENAPSETLAT